MREANVRGSARRLKPRSRLPFSASLSQGPVKNNFTYS